MKKTNIKAIAFDMDGTLLNDINRITDRTKNVLNLLKQKGIELILSTGRSYEALLPYKDDLELNSPVICYNGARILQADGILIKNHMIDNNASGYLIDFARKERVHIQAYRNGILYFEKRTPLAEVYEDHVKLKGEVVNFDDFETFDFTKIMYLGDHETLSELSRSVKSTYSSELSVIFSKPEYLEFMSGGVSKGEAISEVAAHLGIETSSIMAFGDGDNDKSMIETVGIGVAMDNATSGVKAVANKITLSNKDDGVAEFLEDFFEL